MNDTKTEILRVRMTPVEKAALSRQANDQHKTMSEYIRSIAKCPPEVTRDEFDGSILQMIYEINKIGVTSIRSQKSITNTIMWNREQIC